MPLVSRNPTGRASWRGFETSSPPTRKLCSFIISSVSALKVVKPLLTESPFAKLGEGGGWSLGSPSPAARWELRVHVWLCVPGGVCSQLPCTRSMHVCMYAYMHGGVCSHCMPVHACRRVLAASYHERVHACACMHVCLQPAANAHMDVRCRTAFPEDPSGGDDDGGGGGGSRVNPQEARLQRNPSRNRKVRTEGDHIFGGDPDMGWRYRGEVGPPRTSLGGGTGGGTPLKG